ncbi:hypothetical protein [Amycolatopsis sp. NPDC051061]|uniref:YczE/YyaS/YitT family protein n=1 Tax=Amycolatopsis sp. NPDC051061 TaxID=3155042 RepID=UPI00342F7DE6
MEKTMAIHLLPAKSAVMISGHPLAVRLVILAGGTTAMGGGIALLVWSRLGLTPMDVLHTGVSHATGWTFGSGIILCQLVLAMTFIPLRLRPGVGTVAALVIPAVVADGTLALLPTVDAIPIRVAALASGGLLFASGVAIYLSANLGRLPRDGIMMAFAGPPSDDRRARARRVALTRIATDTAFIAGGVALLGPANAVYVGALSPGTLLLAAGSGPLIACLLDILARAPGFSPQTAPAEPRHGTGRHRRAQRATTRGDRAWTTADPGHPAKSGQHLHAWRKRS